jgi:DNA-directed RNA polymerase specialized sigma24 family protein
MSMPLRSFLDDRPERDSADPSTAKTRKRRLGDPTLREAVRATLRKKRIPPREIDDLANETLARAATCDILPDDTVLCRQYVCGVARNVATDHRRGERRRAEANGVPFNELAKWAPRIDPNTLEAELLLENLTKPATVKQRQALGWFLRFALGGDSYATIAGEAGLPYKAVWKAAENARAWLERRVMALGIAFVVLLLVWGSVRDRVRPRQDVADPDKTTTPKVEPTAKPQPQAQVQDTAPKLEEAASLRSKALAACKAKHWMECVDGLRAAKELDPKGDSAPEIQKAWEKAEQAMESKGP